MNDLSSPYIAILRHWTNPKVDDLMMGLLSLFNGISTFVGYLMPKPFSKNRSGTI